MAKLERVYNVPLRKEWLKVPKYKRAAKAMRALRAFALRHMKTEEVIIGPFVNMEVWSHGIRNPPHHVRINAVKEEDGTVVIELFGKPLPKRKEEKPAEKGAVKKAVEALTGLKIRGKKPEETAPEEKKAEALPESVGAKPERATETKQPEKGIEAKESLPGSPKEGKPAPKAPAKKERKAKVVRT